MDRSLQHKGMFHLGDPAVNILTRHGWYWGAYFPDGVDYQHFQKIMLNHYLITGLQYLPPDKQLVTVYLRH